MVKLSLIFIGEYDQKKLLLSLDSVKEQDVFEIIYLVPQDIYEVVCEENIGERIKFHSFNPLKNFEYEYINEGMKHIEGDYFLIVRIGDVFGKKAINKIVSLLEIERPSCLVFGCSIIGAFMKQPMKDKYGIGLHLNQERDTKVLTRPIVDLHTITNGRFYNKVISCDCVGNMENKLESKLYEDEARLVYSMFYNMEKVVFFNRQILNHCVRDWEDYIGERTLTSREDVHLFIKTLLLMSDALRQMEKSSYGSELLTYIMSIIRYQMETIKNLEILRLYFLQVKSVIHEFLPEDIDEWCINERDPWIVCQCINDSKNLSEYFVKRQCYKIEWNEEHLLEELGMRIDGKANIAIVGAGPEGRIAFNLLFKNTTYKLCGWFDYRYNDFPIQDIQKAKGCDSDYYLVIMGNETEDRRIIQRLEAIGINNEQIIWWSGIERYR